jgi:hypothetical protein
VALGFGVTGLLKLEVAKYVNIVLYSASGLVWLVWPVWFWLQCVYAMFLSLGLRISRVLPVGLWDVM